MKNKISTSFYMLNLLSAAAFYMFVSCSSMPKVTRVDAGAQIDISGYWNDTDVRIVCKSLIQDCLNSARVNDAIAGFKGKTPVVLVGVFYNDSDEQKIDTSIISGAMEKAILDSNKLDFVAGDRVRKQIRAERTSQQTNASEASAARLGRELGANFLMTGSVKTMVDMAGNQTVRTYFVRAELTNIETNKLVWVGDNSEIKKVIVRPRYKF
ncbi:MAG: penicillin-binding protein activator LpoB [Spirochaetaceae bacterium]|jgi:hypothetical protein|nr:penicillin-binding protein activator LpoB [Spirochaetaceae bacterium]